MDERINFSPQARRMIADLDASYAARDWIEAQIALRDALREAAERIISGAGTFYNAPALSPPKRASHPLRRYGWRWLLARSYWIGFLADTDTPTIMASFHETSPGSGPLRRSR